MLESQKIQLKQSEIRKKLLDISKTEELTDELRSETETLKTEIGDLETKYQAAVTGENEKKEEIRSNDPSFITLRQKAMASGGYLQAAASGEELRGASGEFNQEKFERTRDEMGQVLVPWHDFLEEQRVDTDTASIGGAGKGPSNYRNPVPRIFDVKSLTGTLGLLPQMVPFATDQIPYINAGTSVANYAENSARPSGTEFTIDQRDLDPRQAIGTVDVSSLVMHRMGPQLESSILSDLMEQTSDYMESEAKDELETVTATAAPTPGTATTWAEATNLFNFMVDGKYASDIAEVRAVSNPDLFHYLTSLYRASDTDVNAWEHLKERLGGLAVSAKVSARGGSGRRAGLFIARKGMASDSFNWSVWDASSLVVDRISSGGTEIKITMISTFQMDAEVARRDSFKRPTCNTA